MAVDALDRSIVVGYESSASGRFAVIVRTTTSGGLDTTFGTSGLVETAAETSIQGTNAFLDVAVQPDGKIVATGVRGSPSTMGLLLARYDADGTPDATFTGSAGANSEHIMGRAIALQSDGKIVVAGNEVLTSTVLPVDAARYAYFSGGRLIVRRYTSAGVPDPTFGTNGTLATRLGMASDTGLSGMAVHVASNGAIYVAGILSRGDTPRGFLARVTGAGVVDMTFGSAGAGVIIASAVGRESALRAIALDGANVFAGGTLYQQPTGNDFLLAKLR
jgi:uncharacterized delta-60 repeat protein